MEKAYGLNHSKPGTEITRSSSTTSEINQETLEAIISEATTKTSEDNHQFRTSAPRELITLLGLDYSKDIRCYTQTQLLTSHGHERLFCTSAAAGKGNSYICFRPKGCKEAEWVAGQIQHIFKRNHETKFVLRRSLPHFIDRDKPDPFKLFWDRGFEAKMVDFEFSTALEVVDSTWVVAHTARWNMETYGVAVCLNLETIVE
ncbi:hypothetical protein F5880DRAFT_1619405 [Lentinula raphanica]|nr:hypothetical protein F5880DRAFT_1619405 [Lentinula raphanica]